MKRGRALGIGLLSVFASLAPGCESSGNSGSETHWLSQCDSAATCGGGLQCRCGTCTLACSMDSDCASLGASAACATPAAASATCGNSTPPPARLCLARCSSTVACPATQACVEGTCVPGGIPDAGAGGMRGGTGGNVSHDASAAGGAANHIDASVDASIERSTEGGVADASAPDGHAVPVDGASGFRVVSVSPSDGESAAAASSLVTATFSASVDPASVEGAFRLGGPAASVSGHVTATDATATFTPEGALPLACSVTATLDASVADLGGIALGAPHSWSFATADGSWRGESSPGGSAYADGALFFDSSSRIAVSRDGSVFAAWAAFDATAANDIASVSRYTAATGWTPLVGFDQGKHPYGVSTPAVAVSDHGEAMVIWGHAAQNAGMWGFTLQAMRYAGGWEAPFTLQGPDLGTNGAAFVVGADPDGGFVAAWIENGGPPHIVDHVRMAHFDPASGWGPVEAPPLGAPDAGQQLRAYNAVVSVNAGGHALVAWRESMTPYDPLVLTAIVTERFEPGTGWSGKEVLAGTETPYYGSYSAPSAVIGNDGTAAVAWVKNQDINEKHTNAIVRTFDGTWSAPVTLNPGLTATGSISVATDSRGGYIAAFYQYDAVGTQVYASRMTRGSAWSAPLLLKVPEALPDGAPTSRGESGPYVVMAPTGDAIVQMSASDATNARTLDAVTYSPKDGWSAPTRLATLTGPGTLAQLDDCGNGAIAWIDLPSNDVMIARHVRGGAWAKTRLATAPSAVYEHVALGVGPSGQTVVSYRSPDDHSQRANVLE